MGPPPPSSFVLVQKFRTLLSPPPHEDSNIQGHEDCARVLRRCGETKNKETAKHWYTITIRKKKGEKAAPPATAPPPPHILKTPREEKARRRLRLLIQPGVECDRAGMHPCGQIDHPQPRVTRTHGRHRKRNRIFYFNIKVKVPYFGRYIDTSENSYRGFQRERRHSASEWQLSRIVRAFVHPSPSQHQLPVVPHKDVPWATFSSVGNARNGCCGRAVF